MSDDNTFAHLIPPDAPEPTEGAILTWKDARGVIPWQAGDEPAEVSIRRSRGDTSDLEQRIAVLEVQVAALEAQLAALQRQLAERDRDGK